MLLQALGGSPRVVRVMPNTPCLVSETAAGMCPGKHVLPGDIDDVGTLFGALGTCLPVTEAQIDGMHECPLSFYRHFPGFVLW